MNKTAVILTGQARSFAQCLPSLHWHVFRHLINPHFYVSVAKDEDADSVDALVKKYPDAPVFIEKVEQPTLPEPPAHLAAFAPYAITPTKTPGVGPYQGIMRQLWHLSRGYKFAIANGAGDADLFIRCRPDLHFARLVWPKADEGLPWSGSAMTPYWGNYGPGVNDRFAVLGSGAAISYFHTYDVMTELLNDGVAFHPESLVGAALERCAIDIRRTLTAEFSILRKDGTHDHMVVFPGEVAAYAAHLSKIS